MKILCICQRGNCRSVALAYLLKDYYGHDAVAIGHETAGDELKSFLLQWSDYAVCMEHSHVSKLPPIPQRKDNVLVCDVGPDIYGHSRNPQLLSKCEDFCRRFKAEYVDAK